MTGAKLRNREQLLLSLANALADEPRASMGQLAAMVGLSRATLCRHFPSREAMMLALFEAGVSQAEQALARARPGEGDVEQCVRRLIEELLPIAELYAYIDQELQDDDAVASRAQPFRESLVSLFQQWQASGELRVDLPAAWLVESMSALLRSAATMIRSGRLARRNAAQNVFGLLWLGMSR